MHSGPGSLGIRAFCVLQNLSMVILSRVIWRKTAFYPGPERNSLMKVSTAVLKNAVSAMVAMFMVLVYNLADTFFIINLSRQDLLFIPIY